MSDLTNIGQLIHELRQKKNLTQEEFAKKLNTTQSAVARIESGEQNLTTEMICKISEALESSLINVSDGAMNIEIHGGKKLTGEIVTKTSKNGAVGLLCASLLNKGKTTLKNVPKIEEVHRIIEVLTSIGVSIKWVENDLEIKVPIKLEMNKINRESAIKTRSIIMFIGPLIHDLNKFQLPQSGGCKLGARSITPHIYAMENFGVKIEAKEKCFEITRDVLKKDQEIILYEAGDTVTENAIMAASRLPGKTVIKYASANYMGQDLCFFLEKLGVKIDGIGTTTITVYGKEKIHEDVTYCLGEDPIDTMFFIAVAATTNSKIKITRCPIDFLEMELLKLEKMGLKFKKSKRYKSLNEKLDLVDIQFSPSKLTALEDKIEAHPYPALNIDNLPFFAVIATQAQGQTFIHDWVYEKRAIYYTDLNKLGADTLLADPHRFYVNGKTMLKPAEVICPPALRPAAIILIGMLAAKGKSILRNIYSINRGYEDIVKRLNSIGADIRIMR
ncbi:MAG: UDP-N-acetylglucosamine 1-carboxyvinyltransferase [bacterium]